MAPDLPDADAARSRYPDCVEHVHHGEGLLREIQAGQRSCLLGTLPRLCGVGQPDPKPCVQLGQCLFDVQVCILFFIFIFVAFKLNNSFLSLSTHYMLLIIIM